ncbi:MAG: ATP-dependent DNA helicase RecG [Alphaproteobacteria bacterium MarineAlpha5_Bin9]|nr:MAG: ATP-dependent DNA helicase RecG [Alphaproteobacteria bacterium MarineAlpha5_Bin9]|tara:strand:- start:2326 stop:4407 length:2082 start_codon:yes stop_codon:yes gene_type:complete
MRSEQINYLFKPFSSIKGIGPKIEILLKKFIGDKLIHLLWHVPYNFIKKEKICKLDEKYINKIIIIKVKVLDHFPSRYIKQPYKIKCILNEKIIYLVFFNAKHSYLKSNYEMNSDIILSGKLEHFKNEYQITHPTKYLKNKNIDDVKIIEPVYRLTSGLTNKFFLKIMNIITKDLPQLDEWIDNKTLIKFNLKSWNESIYNLHHPNEKSDFDFNNVYRRRIAFDELFAHQLALKIMKNYDQKQKGIAFIDKKNLVNKCIQNLDFDLTKSQKDVWNEIYNDLISSKHTVRLLQGDVGSGKTIIALLSMLLSVESKFQAVIMAPTSILAQQHYDNIKKYITNLDVKILTLTSRDKGLKRINKLNLIKEGKADIIIGTHSLIQDDVKYKSIGLVVIDEQHKFGVLQRMAFSNKSKKPSIIVMSATPIPRTLALAIYGDMDESKIIEKPKGRIPTLTKSIPIAKTKNLINRLKSKLNKNDKVYWVCPLIEESERLDLQAATNRFNELYKTFNKKVLLLHGQMKENEKEIIMKKFKDQDYKILVTTTVIEVGIDIKEVNTLIIEHSERFGLAQLHQLRGRVGRNNKESICVLIYQNNLSKNAKKRIEVMKETNNGFKIAEKDLQIRGPGELLGKKQSGLPDFNIADLNSDKDLLDEAILNVENFIKNDPEFKTSKAQNIKNLLYLFEKNNALKTLLAG